MKTLYVLGTTLALAACGQKADTAADDGIAATPSAAETVATAPATSATQAPTGDAAGKYEITTPDGTRITSTLNRDGSYLDIANGKEVRGTWRLKGAQTCFDPAGDEAERCYSSSAPAADGSFKVTGSDGTVSTSRKIGTAPAM